VSDTESKARSTPRRLQILAGLLLIVACSDDAPSPPIPLPDGKSDAFGELPVEVAGFKVTRGAAPGYVRDQACKECHASVYESYQAVGMARSFYRLTRETAVEDFSKTFFQKETRFYYEMFERDGKYYQKRYCKDREGVRFAEHEAEIAWVVGSGNHARTYLAQTEHGEMFELPMSWYAGLGWDMSPGFGMAGHDRFERQIRRGCMFCHNAYPEVPVGSDLPGEPHLFPNEMPHGIGCQRCHGPGARHIEAAADPDGKDEDVLARILNPGRLTPQKQEEVCMTCHMQPDVSSGGNSTSRAFDRAMYSHRPDQSIMDYLVYFDFGTTADRDVKIEVNHHGHRMRQSRCHSASGGKLTCVTCHDPHRKVTEKNRVAFYRGKCVQCHKLDDCEAEEMGESIKPSEADCVSCHMLEARPRDVQQMTITDHRIRRKPPSRSLLAVHVPAMRTAAEKFETVACFPSRAPKGAMLDLHTGLAKSRNLRLDEVPALRAALRTADPKVPNAFVRAAIAIGGARDYATAVEVLRTGLAKFPSDFSLRFNLAMMLYRIGKNAEAMKQLDQALAIERRPRALELLGNLYVTVGELQPAKAAFEESLKLRPIRAKTWRRYANTLDGLGLTDLAATAFQNALNRNPDEPEIYRRLAAIHVRQGKIKAALRVLQQGASRSLELELELIQQRCAGDQRLRDAKTAVTLARTAVIEHAGSGPAHLYLAFALTITGDSRAARPILATARSLGADPASCAGLSLLYALQRKDEPEVDALLIQFRQAMVKPDPERLREPINRILAAMLANRRGK